MNPLQILIAEDNHAYALELERYVQHLDIKSIKIVSHSTAVFEAMEESKPDLLIINTHLKGALKGIQVAEAILPLGIPILFISDQKDLETYNIAKKTKPIGYIIRPFNPITLKGLIELALPKFQLHQPNGRTSSDSLKAPDLTEYIFIKKGNLLCKVLLSEIDWISSEKNYCTVISNGKKYPLKTSLRKIALQLPPKQFFQIHKSFIVRIDNIEQIDLVSNKVLLNGNDLPLGRTYKAGLLEQLGVLR